MTLTKQTSDDVVVIDGVSCAMRDDLLAALRGLDVHAAYDGHSLSIPAVLGGVTPGMYRAFLQSLDDSSLPHAYHEGTLEMMSPGKDHDRLKKLIARMIEIISFDRQIPIQAIGSTTIRAAGFERGAEPDECYYIAHEPQVRDKQDYDPTRDPPPDLAIEVEGSRRLGRRISVYAELGVPELWRCLAGQVRFYRLNGADYVEIGASIAFPFLTPADLNQFLAQRTKLDENALLRALLHHLRPK